MLAIYCQAWGLPLNKLLRRHTGGQGYRRTNIRPSQTPLFFSARPRVEFITVVVCRTYCGSLHLLKSSSKGLCIKNICPKHFVTGGWQSSCALSTIKACVYQVLRNSETAPLLWLHNVGMAAQSTSQFNLVTFFHPDAIEES